MSLEGTAGSGHMARSTAILLRLLAALTIGGAAACDGGGGGGGGATPLPPRPTPPPPTVVDFPTAFSSISSLGQDGTTGGAGGSAVIARSAAGLAGFTSGADPVLAALTDVTAEQLALGGGAGSGSLSPVAASLTGTATFPRSGDDAALPLRAELGASASVERESVTPPAPVVDRPIGFASIDALGQPGTTGGGAGRVVIARTLEEFAQLISESDPLIVMIDSTIALDGRMLDVASDKTIIGIGSSAALLNGGLLIGLRPRNDTSFPPNAVRNVIVRNISFSDCPNDCITVQEFSHHVWIDHNEFRRPFDGAVDIVRGADIVEVSWNVFAGTNFTILLGASENDIDRDLGRLRVSFHHNWFNGTVQRNPRVRFGEPVHVFNNYYSNISSYGIASQEDAGVLVEGNFFENTRRPTRNDVAGAPGRLVQRQNVFFASDAPFAVGAVVEPSTFYSYTLDDPNDVPFLVRSGAGVGRVVF